MNVYVNEVTGIADAIVSMFFSKRTWTRELEEEIRSTVNFVTDYKGQLLREEQIPDGGKYLLEKYNDWIEKLTKWSGIHITLGRFVDFSITVENCHRGAGDDWDAHAQRFNNRIIRSSTRLAEFHDGEMSDYYKGKIITTASAMDILGIDTPETIDVDGVKYVKCVNGYIKEEYKNDPDVKRGLYMLSIPWCFIFKCNLTEWAHVYKQRRVEGHANDEVKELCETICDQLYEFQPWLTRDLFHYIQN